jgi:hypothetical protein
MEFDMELLFNCSPLDPKLLEISRLLDGAIIESRSTHSSALRTGKSVIGATTLAVALAGFLGSLTSIKGILAQHECKIRIGAFWDVNKLAFASIDLPPNEIGELCSLNLGVEISVYPVNDSES